MWILFTATVAHCLITFDFDAIWISLFQVFLICVLYNQIVRIVDLLPREGSKKKDETTSN